VPHLRKIKDVDFALVQTVLGVLNHGQNFTVYRTFHNVSKSSSLICTAILKEIERRWKNDDKDGKRHPYSLSAD